ncbi:hypothetical protein [Thalassotalea piscium]|uniref:FkbM family methyltransferase n=1 Tax=Thalassotalea piscium TaxID=1230533 RepID=A0A7X0TT54_9GAMM|nr:hypothetical protein [Thalassotalea piscium]MBB6542789.1 hypothetical protein [Thalassotalea piscium]
MKTFCFNDLLADDQFLLDLGKLDIVDVGAQVLDYEKHIYQPLVENLNTTIVGFEPVTEARDKYVAVGGKCKIFPFVIGDGQDAIFYETNNSALSSVYKPNIALRQRFVGGHGMYGVKDAQSVKTKKLDDIKSISNCDF